MGFAIDHHRPRRGDSARPDLENDYINLYWTCGECNQNKGHTWPTAAETARGYDGDDGDGNAIAYASGTLDYDEESRLGSLTISGGTSPGYRAGYRGDGLRAWRVSSSGTVTYFVYDEASGTLQYEVEGSAGAYTIRNAYGHGAAGLAQRFQPTVANRVTSFAYDPSGNTISRSISSGTSTQPSGYPTEVALYDGYGKPVADVSCSVAYSTTTGPTSYGAELQRRVRRAQRKRGVFHEWGYYTENNTQLVTGNVRDRGLLLCTHRYYDPINARWLNRDGAGYDGDVNIYDYVQGNPVMDADPSGLDAVFIYGPDWRSNDQTWKYLAEYWANLHDQDAARRKTGQKSHVFLVRCFQDIQNSLNTKNIDTLVIRRAFRNHRRSQ